MKATLARATRTLALSLAAASLGLASLGLVEACKLNMISDTVLSRAEDTVAPTLTISSPTDGFLCANIVEVHGLVSDKANGGKSGKVSSLSYEIPGSTIGGSIPMAADGSFTCQFDTDSLGTSFFLTIKAVNWNSNTTHSSINLKKSATGSTLPSFAAAATSKKLVLTWDEVPNTASYTLYYSDTGSLPSDTVGTTITNVTSPYTLGAARTAVSMCCSSKPRPAPAVPTASRTISRAYLSRPRLLRPVSTGCAARST